jgi:class 3 adenylate cyclase
MHSGAHYGDVTQTHDGDLYGQTINIAARLLSLAAPGQQVVSAEFAAAAALDTPRLRSMGPKRLKNVPEPVECHEILAAQEA